MSGIATLDDCESNRVWNGADATLHTFSSCSMRGVMQAEVAVVSMMMMMTDGDLKTVESDDYCCCTSMLIGKMPKRREMKMSDGHEIDGDGAPESG